MAGGIPFGSYTLLRRLARGGMAEVFLAAQKGPEGFERQIAIKRILPHLVDATEFVEMFMDEARLAARLVHQNIAHIYEFGKVGEYYFIAMEYIDGLDISDLCRSAREAPVPVEHAVRIAADTCAGLHYAHGQGVVHRDVSPQNVLVSYDGAVKLVDFGIAKAAHQMNRTRPGVIKGKYAYMSPEQVDGKTLDGRSDVFNVGIVLYELVTGVPLFRRDDAMAAMKQIRAGRLVPPEHHRPEIGPGLSRVICQALASDREARFASAAEMQVGLERVLQTMGKISTSALLAEFVRSRRAPRWLSEEDRSSSSPDGTRPSRQGLRAVSRQTVLSSESEADATRPDAPAALEPTVAAHEDPPTRPGRPAPRPRAGGVSAASETALISRGRRRMGVVVAAGIAIVGGVAAALVIGRPGRSAQAARAAEAGAAPAAAGAAGLGPSGPAAAMPAVEPGAAPAALGQPATLARAAETRPGSAAGAVEPPVAAPTPAAAPAPEPHRAPRAARLTVRSNPAGAQVAVDGRSLGKTPLSNTTLAPGEHSIALAMAGRVRRERRIRVGPGETQTLEIELPRAPSAGPAPRAPSGYLTVRTMPWARVYEGSRLIGTTPLAYHPLAAGSHHLLFVTDQGKRAERQVEIQPDHEAKLSLDIK